jgi:UDP-N-acetylmuramate dehydrogenase
MKAGAHGAEMASVVGSIDVVRLVEDPGRTEVAASEAGFRYRRSGLPADAVVVGARFHLHPGDRDVIRDEMDRAREWRRQTQPIAEPNCGSVFKNPPDDHAARLIDAAGLKGTSVGGARVSEKHANFIVAGHGARAGDVLSLIHAVQTRVAETAGVHLEPEVQMIGAFEA